MPVSIFVLFIITFINKFKPSLLYLFYELKTLEEKNTIESLLSFNSTYTLLEIGTPPQKVNFYFTLNHHEISFTNNNNDITCSPQNSFYPKKSSTFKGPFEIEKRKDYSDHKYIYTDNFKTLNGIINFSYDNEIEEFPFFSMEKINFNDSDYLCGYIGLAIMQYVIYKPDEDIMKKINENLAKYGIKRNDDFSFFNKDGKDYLIYGVHLHNQFPDKFKNIKIEYLHPSMRINCFELFWEIAMKEVYYNDVYSNPNKFITFAINPLFELIVGTNEYKNNIIRDYFKEYFNNNICSIEEYQNHNLIVFSCFENKFNINDIKKFPNLYLSNIGLHYTFELKGEELFTKINNKWHFEIVFPIKDLAPVRWIIGRIFLRKYPITFSPSSRLIGFYLNKEIKTEKEKKEEKKEQKIIDEINKNKNGNYFTKDLLGYIKIIIIALIFTIVGLIIGKKIFALRKKRANELVDDYYQYDSEKKDIKNDNLTSANIEMNSKLGLK